VEGSTQGPEGPAADELRSGLKSMWSVVAGGWGENADFVDARGAALTKRMLEAVYPKPGERVLELASGPGGLGLAAAERVGPDGEAVLSDVAREMTAIASRRADALGLTNVTTLELELESIEQPDDSYDVVLCREGLMLVLDPARAAGEIQRILRPGGRAAISVWGSRDRNPWLAVLLDSVGAELGGTFPPPGVPGPFSLDDSEKLRAVLSGGGLSGVDVSEVEVPWRGSSIDEWWSVTSALAGPLTKILEAQPPDTVKQIRSRAGEALAQYEKGDGLEVPGVALLGTGRVE
jgi:SAM-dependent methyltransferase